VRLVIVLSSQIVFVENCDKSILIKFESIVEKPMIGDFHVNLSIDQRLEVLAFMESILHIYAL